MSSDVQFVNPSGSAQRWRVIFATFGTYLYDSYDLAILAVVMPTLLKLLNITTTLGGLLTSATMIGAALGSILFGLIAENYGRKRALIIALIWFGLGTAAIYLISSWAAWMVLRFLTGIAIGGVWGPCVAIIGRHWAPKFLARATAFMLSTFALGWILSALAGRFVLGTDWRLLFLFGSTSVLVAALVFWLVPDDSVKRDPDKAKAAKADSVKLSELFGPGQAKLTILATLTNVCQMGGFWGIGSWIPTFLVKERGLAQTNMTYFLMLMYGGMFLGYQIFGWLGDRIGRKRAIMVCFAMDVVTIPIYLLVHNVNFLFAFGPVMGLAFGGVFGLAGAFYAELFPERFRALGSGFCFNVGRIGAVVAPYTVGLLATHYGLATGIITAPIIFGCGLIVTAFLPETLKRLASDKDTASVEASTAVK